MPANHQHITRVFDILDHAVKTYPSAHFLNAKRGNSWLSFSTEDVKKLSDKLAGGLIANGVTHGDLCAIVAYNGAEWNITDFAIQKAGAVTIPLYHNLSVADYAYILKQAEVKVLFVATTAFYDRIAPVLSELDYKPLVYCFEPHNYVPSWEELMNQAPADYESVVAGRKAHVKAEDLCSILYTSGTTGNPNGVMLTHDNLVCNAQDGAERIPVNPRERALSFLPVSHAFERTVINILMMCGVEIWYSDSLETVGDNLREIKPQLFTTVPRMLEKVYDRILSKGREQKGIKRAMFFWALMLAMRFRPGRERTFWYNLQLGIARKLVFTKWQAALGGNLRVVVSGGAALQERLGRVFWGAGIRIMEGYGLTEASPVISVNHLEEENNRVATLGIPLRRCVVKLADDGEVLVKGPNVFKGYYKNPELTAAAFDEEGYLKTGDIAKWEDERFLKMQDRKKDLFKTSGGLYIAPQPIELMLKECPIFEQVVVIGENRKFPAAIISVNWQGLKDWAAIHNLTWTTDLEMLNHKEVQQKFEREINQRNEKLAPYKQIKKFIVVPDTWSVETGELTVTMKIKRRVVLSKYAELVEAVYRG